ncbi:hypothetical protein GCM10007382_10660 [Salinibacterium xinjiangense]|nr:hypothetical protein GCM10007382_10660 [Salinibacterium xinjiangense]
MSEPAADNPSSALGMLASHDVDRIDHPQRDYCENCSIRALPTGPHPFAADDAITRDGHALAARTR